MDYTTHFRLTKRNTYFCGCDKEFDNLDDAICHHESGEIDGFCENGIKRCYVNSDVRQDEFECVCGKKGDWYYITDCHHHIFKQSCMTERLRKQNSYCKSCNLQCESVKNYEVHCMTEKHRRNVKGHINLPLKCDLCNITCRCQTEIIAHIQTKRHKSREQINEPVLPLECKVCNIKCRGQKEIKAHIQTKKHLLRLESPPLDLECKICNVKFPSQVNARRHFASKKHTGMVASGQISDEKIPLTCDICNIKCTSQKQIKAHLQTKKHLFRIDDVCQSIGSKETNE